MVTHTSLLQSVSDFNQSENCPSSVRTRAGILSWNWRITAIISPCTPYLPRQLSVDRIVGLLKVDEAHVHSGIPPYRPSSWSRSTTNSMSTVDRWGLKPDCSSSTPQTLHLSLRRFATIIITLPSETRSFSVVPAVGYVAVLGAL